MCSILFIFNSQTIMYCIALAPQINTFWVFLSLSKNQSAGRANPCSGIQVTPVSNLPRIIVYSAYNCGLEPANNVYLFTISTYLVEQDGRHTNENMRMIVLLLFSRIFVNVEMLLHIVLGDLNLTIEDSSLLQTWHKKGPMVNANCTAPEDVRWKPTCHQGKGSRIDHIFAYKNSIDLVHNYQISRTPCSTNRSMISIDLIVPKTVRTRRQAPTVMSCKILCLSLFMSL